MCINFQTKQTTLTFLAESLILDSESAFLRSYVHQFSDKTDHFKLLDPNLLKNWFWGQKSKSGFGISILEILRAPIFRQNGQLWIFGPKFAQKWVLRSEFQKSMSGFKICILEILCALIFRKKKQVWIIGPKFA